MTDSGQPIDWSKTTFAGSRLEQLRRWRKLTVRERLEALDSMSEFAERMRERRLRDAVREAESD